MTLPDNPEKNIKDLNKKDLVEIVRYGEWDTNYEQFITKEYLGASVFEDIVFVQENVSLVETMYVRYCLEDFLAERGFAIFKTCEIGHDGDYAAAYSNVEYDHKKYRRCMSNGSYFLSKKNTEGVDEKLILSINPYPEYTVFKFSSNRNSSIKGDKLMEDLIAFARKNNFLHGRKIDGNCQFIPLDTKYTWDDLILDDEQKESVRKNLFNLIEHSDIYNKNGIVIKRGLIFKGPPGTGKTLLAKILCSTISWTVVWVTPGHLDDSRDIRRIVGMCRDLSPAILFLEDIDLYGGVRSQNKDGSLLGELMNQLDGLEENRNIITIATTNDVDSLEKALLKRPGRFDKVIEFGQPGKKALVRMLQLFTKDLALDTDVNLEKLADSAKDFTGAQVRELVNMAVLCALDAGSYDEEKKLLVKKAHFEEAQGTVKDKDYKSVGFVQPSKRNNNECPSLEDLLGDMED